MTAGPHLLCFLLFLPCALGEPLAFDAAGQRITYYPASLFVSHTPRALAFFADTKLVHLSVKLKPLPPGPPPTLNVRCSSHENEFLKTPLTSTAGVQRSIRRLLAMPGFSNLIECDSYLRRSYHYATGLESTMVCPRIYKSSLSECKSWALQVCTHHSPDERLWLQPHSRRKRSSWMCHAGVFGIFRKIYESTGHSCDSTGVSNLFSTLQFISSSMALSQSLVHTVHGKVVYLIKTTDTLNTKLTSVIGTLHEIDSTFLSWQSQLTNFSKVEQCHYNSLLEFMSHFSTSVNRAFYSMLRFNEIEDTLTQISHLSQKDLISYSHLPRFITTEISARLDGDPSLKFTTRALAEGFPLLVQPMIDLEHNGKHLDLSVLITVPEIRNTDSFCTVEYLSPIKYNVSGTCYTGPLVSDDLALITCANTKSLLKADSLAKCFQQDNTLLCPENILNLVKDTEWLGLPWTPTSKASFPRRHQQSQDCSDIHPLLHLGGRYYLATTTADITLNTGPLELSPLTIYHFPCNVTFPGMSTGVSNCPKRIDIRVPLLHPEHIQYFPWEPQSNDSTLLSLHHQSLRIPEPAALDNRTLQQLDRTYKILDGQLTQTLNDVQTNLSKIKERYDTTGTQVCAYLVLGLAIINLLLLLVLLRRLYSRRAGPPVVQDIPHPAEPDNCPDCDLPLRSLPSS